MSNLGTMVGKIRDDINRGPAYDARIKRAIESAIAFYSSDRFWFNTKRATASTLVSYDFISLPQDVIEVDHIRLTDPDDSDSYTLNEVTYDWIEDHRDDDNESEPTRFAVHDYQLHLHPIPDKAYTLTMTYHHKLTDVSASASDGASNAWMTDGEELIRMRAHADILETHIRGDENLQLAVRLRLRADEAWTRMKKRANRIQSSGKLASHL